MVASARGIVVQLQTDAIKRSDIFSVQEIWTAASPALVATQQLAKQP